jgi:hypothetical protein
MAGLAFLLLAPNQDSTTFSLTIRPQIAFFILFA